MATYRKGWFCAKTGPTEVATSQDIAWFAGIWEGEGSVGVSKNKDHYLSFKICAVQKERWILDRIRILFGGNVCRRSTSDISRGYEWKSTGPRALGIAQTIYKFLSPHRKEQVLLAMKEISCGNI